MSDALTLLALAGLFFGLLLPTVILLWTVAIDELRRLRVKR